MTQGPPDPAGRPELSEEELRQLEAEMDRITVDDVLLQTIVSLLNLGARKAGMGAPQGQEPPEPDLEQLRQAIEGARALLPVVEPRHGQQLGPIKETLSRLQMIYVQATGGPPPPGPEAAAPGAPPPPPGPAEPAPGPPQPDEEGRGPAQRSGRLWIPGQ